MEFVTEHVVDSKLFQIRWKYDPETGELEGTVGKRLLDQALRAELETGLPEEEVAMAANVLVEALIQDVLNQKGWEDMWEELQEVLGESG